MKKLGKILLVGLMSTSLVGCSGHLFGGPTPTPTPDPYEEMSDWTDVQSKFEKLEAKLVTELTEGNTVTEENRSEMLTTIVEGYEKIKDGIYLDETEDMLKFYETARKLEFSGDPGLASLGESAKAMLFSYYGFTAEDGVTAGYNLYANLMNYADELSIQPEEPKGYSENLIEIDKNGIEANAESMVDPEAVATPEPTAPLETENPENVEQSDQQAIESTADTVNVAE